MGEVNYLCLDVDIDHDVPNLRFNKAGESRVPLNFALLMWNQRSKGQPRCAGASFPTKLGAIWSAVASRPPSRGGQSWIPHRISSPNRCQPFWVKCVLLHRDGNDHSAPSIQRYLDCSTVDAFK